MLRQVIFLSAMKDPIPGDTKKYVQGNRLGSVLGINQGWVFDANILSIKPIIVERVCCNVFFAVFLLGVALLI